MPAGYWTYIPAWVAACMLCTILGGCESAPIRTAPIEHLVSATGEQAPAPYRIGVNDEIEVKFFFAPELNDRLLVRPDGKVSLMFAQDVQAAGRTTEELTAILKKRMARHIKQPEMIVVVRNFGSQRVFVGGEVKKPGPVQLAGRQNVLQVLNEAGWITPEAGPDKVVLVRRGQDGKENIYPINVDRLTHGEDMDQNVIVMAGDLILVPPSDAVSADRWVDQNIRQLLPFSTGMNAAYYLNRGP